MAGYTHRCTGCYAELRSKRDMRQEIGDVYSSWRCRHCGTTVPGMVAERLKHES